MNIIRCSNEDEVGKAACAMTLAAMAKPGARISITAGSTPKRMYSYMIPIVKRNPLYQDVQYYNFDEIPQSGEEEGLTMQALRTLFFQRANIEDSQIHILNEHTYLSWEAKLQSFGYLDYVVMGLGKDGHFCGNLPGTCSFQDETHAVSCTLHDTLYQRILYLSGNDKSKVPSYYVTMGPKTLMKCKQIVIIVTGKEKAEIANRAFFGDVTSQVPASIFQIHPNVTLLIDEEAASCFP